MNIEGTIPPSHRKLTTTYNLMRTLAFGCRTVDTRKQWDINALDTRISFNCVFRAESSFLAGFRSLRNFQGPHSVYAPYLVLCLNLGTSHYARGHLVALIISNWTGTASPFSALEPCMSTKLCRRIVNVRRIQHPKNLGLLHLHIWFERS